MRSVQADKSGDCWLSGRSSIHEQRHRCVLRTAWGGIAVEPSWIEGILFPQAHYLLQSAVGFLLSWRRIATQDFLAQMLRDAKSPYPQKRLAA